MSYLIVKDKSTKPLVLNESYDESGKKKYIYEGIFTPIGIKNRNERIYDEDEVLRHLSYLRDKIKKEGCIYGELDHPEGRFEIYLKEVSHQILDLWYDPKQKCVMGKLELLPTTNGKIMMALVDAGGPLFVSSRAAGTVGADSHVSIQQIFTYDIVATPGFEQCRLDSVTESMKLAVSQFINESKTVKKSPNQASKYGVMDEHVEIIETDSVPELNERKNFNIDMNNLTQPLVNEDIKVKITPEKAEELGINLGSTSDGGDDVDTGTSEEVSADDILDIVPTYAEQDSNEIEDIQPEFDSADTNAENTDGSTATSGENQMSNPFMSESCKKKEESEQVDFEEEKKLDEEDEDISETDSTPNPVADGKLGSDTDKVQHSSDTKEKKNEKTMKNDDSETVKKLQNKKNDVKESTIDTIEYYKSILEGYKIKEQIKDTIVTNYPFSISLSESNFAKFAQLSEQDKRLCADYIFENQIYDIRQINDQFMRPLDARINEQKNYLRLADSSDLDLYNNAPKELRESIDKLAELYILESKSDVEEFWARTGIRNFAANQVKNETFVQNFNNKMTVNENGTDWDAIKKFGYDKNFINLIGSLM